MSEMKIVARMTRPEMNFSPALSDEPLVTLSSAQAEITKKDERIAELEAYFLKCVSNETFLEQDAKRVAETERWKARAEAAEAKLAAAFADYSAQLAESAHEESSKAPLSVAAIEPQPITDHDPYNWDSLHILEGRN